MVAIRESVADKAG